MHFISLIFYINYDNKVNEVIEIFYVQIYFIYCGTAEYLANS